MSGQGLESALDTVQGDQQCDAKPKHMPAKIALITACSYAQPCSEVVD